MKKAKTGDTVKVHYVGRLEDGSVFDTSINETPLKFTIGEGNLIPGFERAVVGMSPGESKTEIVSPTEGYGEPREDLLIDIEKENIPPEIEPEIGEVLLVKQPDGYPVKVTIVAIADGFVTLDANHPLAGKNLVFEINLVEII
ncbi:MAG: peptidylprolyl isomerase [Candidatus Margulisiibacteriota bacterium]|nr:MAG: peptidylprolyl isomerase [Candidatus Margulisbacteria bacterium GWD2_39_127]OGI03218.1 MAG: peptidylprolyl isomerase [Candidatus Margulisbacteria bacterium GWF2_38_17]OGI11242.1 MAG: peptidylprolyl isomerase [Candidatus Margulisbacteria bacterium GWE2_39_32]PZM78543.1 MAG: peptidylprolyl isomerase [Candidatus Margulisiibacteriota bacterium]HAR63890.1 peptidylprolyl isomerase [Candidatus Margulisiibacteriota bacterium]